MKNHYQEGIAMGMMTVEVDDCKLGNLDGLLADLKSSIKNSAKNATPTHEVERNILQRVLKIGQQALGYFFHVQGDGDLGDSMIGSDGVKYKQLKHRTRAYQSVFGCYQLSRAVYGTQEGRRIEICPLDTRLQLPKQQHSYLLQEWSQIVAVEVPFKKTMDLLK